MKKLKHNIVETPRGLVGGGASQAGEMGGGFEIFETSGGSGFSHKNVGVGEKSFKKGGYHLFSY